MLMNDHRWAEHNNGRAWLTEISHGHPLLPSAREIAVAPPSMRSLSPPRDVRSPLARLSVADDAMGASRSAVGSDGETDAPRSVIGHRWRDGRRSLGDRWR